MPKAKKLAGAIIKLAFRRHLRELGFIGGTLTSREMRLALRYAVHPSRAKGDALVRRFEAQFARRLGVRYAFAFGAGRMALYAILKALGIGPGDEVILGSFACVVVPNAIVYCGAKPVYVDINPTTWCIDVGQIPQKITSRTRAIIAQHNFAAMCDMNRINDLARKYKLKVIEDCAHALGAEYRGRLLGTLSDAAYFTTEQSKLISTVMGGVAATNDPEVARRLAGVQATAVDPSAAEIRELACKAVAHYVLGSPWNYAWGKHVLGFLDRYFQPSTTAAEMRGEMPLSYPKRMSGFQAAMGLLQLDTLDANLRARRASAARYRTICQRHGLPTNDGTVEGYQPPYIRYAFLVDDRRRWQEVFARAGIALGEWFNDPIHPQGSSHQAVNYDYGTCPVAEDIARRIVNLPTHIKVGSGEIKRVAALVDSLVAGQEGHA